MRSEEDYMIKYSLQYEATYVLLWGSWCIKRSGQGSEAIEKSYWIINQVAYAYVYDMDITYADCMCCVYTPCTAHFGVHTYVCLRLLY